MSEWLDIDQMVGMLLELAQRRGVILSRMDATVCCLHAIKSSAVPLYDPSGSPIEMPELANAAFLDDMAAEIYARTGIAPLDCLKARDE